MQKLIYWSGQYLLAASSMFALLVCIDVFLRGEALETGWRESLAWSVLAAAIFIGSRYYRAERDATCAMCRHPDTKR
ncbi:hypothetical protein [Massilia sp. BSC265]|uniref:hypothetical protein n=1 Tax=Massilia sp. BSC265 TaxID=1549812 RepID=UPI0004E8985F|nr:hypothetical protein [Massilia sp. BSC265]KFI07716.1 hypothetical protein JN27_09135 [Massilia sp. BSC265]